MIVYTILTSILSLHLSKRVEILFRVERSSGAVRTACGIQIDGRRGQGGQS